MGNERNAESRVNDALRAETVLKQESKFNALIVRPGTLSPAPSGPRAA